MHQRPITRLAAAVVAAAFLLGACSSGGDDEAENDTTVTTQDPAGDEGTDEGTDEDGEGDGEDEGGDGEDEGPTTTEAGGDGGGDGGDAPDLSGDARSYAEAFAGSLKGNPDFPVDDAQIDCYAGRTINTIGADRLRAAGMEPADLGQSDPETPFDLSAIELTEEDANRIYGHFGECGIDIRAAMLEGMAQDPDTSAAAAACYEGALTDDIVRTLMVSSFMTGGDLDPDDPAMGAVMGALMGCAFLDMDMG